MRHRLLSLATVCFLLYCTAPLSAEPPKQHATTEVLRQQLQRMLDRVEDLREDGQEDLAQELSRRAAVVALELESLQNKPRNDERSEPDMGRAQREEARWRLEVLELLQGLREQVDHLSREVTELREQIDQQQRREKEIRLGNVDLNGRWLMTLPAGFKYEAVITQQADELYQLKVRGNLAGLYQHQGSRLTVRVPNDKRLTEFVWELQDENLLLLTQSPSVAKIGADYRGAILRRWQAETDETREFSGTEPSPAGE